MPSPSDASFPHLRPVLRGAVSNQLVKRIHRIQQMLVLCTRDEILVGNRQAAVINLRHNSRRTIQDIRFQPYALVLFENFMPQRFIGDPRSDAVSVKIRRAQCGALVLHLPIDPCRKPCRSSSWPIFDSKNVTFTPSWCKIDE